MSQFRGRFERVQLSNDVFEGENNAYLLEDPADGQVTLIDTGMPTPDTRGQLQDGLAAVDVSFADIDEILLTHFHADHAGLAGEIQEESGATVYAHELDAPLIEYDRSAWAAFDSRRSNRLDAWGMPAEKQAAVIDSMVSFPDQPEQIPTVTQLSDGDTFSAMGGELAVVHLPGHTQGLVGFAMEVPGGLELFTGDALLPYYTPNVGGADIRVEDPLASYIESLCKIIELDPSIVHPGHRNTIEDPAKRAVEILTHHRARTERVIEHVDPLSPTTAWEISASLFGHLEGIHILHGPGEVDAHLRHLETHGAVEETDDGWVSFGEPNVEAMFPPVAL